MEAVDRTTFAPSSVELSSVTMGWRLPQVGARTDWIARATARSAVKRDEDRDHWNDLSHPRCSPSSWPRIEPAS